MIIGHPPLSSSSLSSAAQCQHPQCSWLTPTTSSTSYGNNVQPWPWKMAGARKWLGARRRKRASLICEAAASPYDILGVPRTASEKEIKQAYRKLALKYHPDVNKAPDAQQKFMAIKNAYQTLVDTKSRAKYDRSSESADGFNWGFPKSEKEEEDFYGIEDFFRDLQADFEKAAASGTPKSLWEELAEIGEEFVEFLEKELTNIVDTNQSVWEKEDIYGFKSKEERGSSNASDKNDKSNAEERGKKTENEIEDLLTKLKEELGL